MLTIALRLRTPPLSAVLPSTSPFKVFAEEAYAAGVTVGGSGLTAAAVAGTLNQEQFYELMDDIALSLTRYRRQEMVDLWKAANAVDGNPANERASASAITIAYSHKCRIFL